MRISYIVSPVVGLDGGSEALMLPSHGANFFFFCGITHSTPMLIEVNSLHDATIEWVISWRLAPCTQAVQIVPSGCPFTSVSGVHCHMQAIYWVMRGREKFLHHEAHQKPPPHLNDAREAIAGLTMMAAHYSLSQQLDTQVIVKLYIQANPWRLFYQSSMFD